MGSSGLAGVLLLALLLPHQLLLSNGESIGYGVVQVNSNALINLKATRRQLSPWLDPPC
jgi:hypothetical protein